MNKQKLKTLQGLQHLVATAFCLFSTLLLASAGEKLPMLKVGSDVYSNVTVTAVTATDIFFTSSKGVANAKLKNLEPAMQKHFNFDAAKAEAVSQAQKAAAEQASLLGNASGDVKINRKNAQAVKDEAITKVKAIVNQTVNPWPRTPDMVVSLFSPGWFHDGAIEPEYATVDVRETQDTKPYSPHAYVSSDLNPGIAFAGSDVEFNSMTKFFYTNRSVPKKKLTEAEMLEINRLYRIIAQCDEKLQPPTVLAANFLAGNRNVLIAVAAGILLILIPIRLLRNKPSF